MRSTLKVMKLLPLLALGLLWIVPFYAQFGGNHGLTIISADYGSSGKYRSVTSILKGMVRNDRLSIQVNNQTLGGDPAPGKEKELIVRYRYRGQEDEVRVREGELLNLPGGGGAQGGYGGFRIVSATYGVGGSYRNVEGLLRRMASNDGLTILVSNETMGGDPAPGREKELIVSYQYRGRRDQARVGEGDTLNLGRAGGGGGGYGNHYGGLRILSATYGVGGNYRNVEGILRRMASNDGLTILVTNETMGGDPAPGREKELIVRYELGRRQNETRVPEGDTLNLGSGGDDGGGNQYGDLRIVSAEYGGSGRYRDVAPRLRGMVQNGRLKVKVTNDNMGGDPAVDVDKKLRVIYDYRGDRGEKEEDEGNTLEIP
jgi:DnaJ-like protein